MSLYLSPSVIVKETDLSTSIALPASSITGTVGQFKKGPGLERKLITNPRALEQTFGEPTNENYVDWYTAWNILQYNQLLYVVRAIPEDALNSGLGVGETTFYDTNVTDYRINDDVEFDENNITFLEEMRDIGGTPTLVQVENLRILARYPGAYGDNIKISMCDSTNYTTGTVVGATKFVDYFDRPDIGVNEIVIIVHDVDPNDTDEYIVVESFICSTDPNAKNYAGESTWVGQYINRNSKYICAFTNIYETFPVHTFSEQSLIDGADGTLQISDFMAAYDLFANSEEFDVNLLVDTHNSIFATAANLATIQQYLIDNVVESRKDCFAILSAPKSTVVDNKGSEATETVEYKNTTLNRPSTYGAIYGNWKYQYDSYNDKYRWLPVSGDVAGIFSASDAAREVWFAPAGLTRGQMKNVVKFGFNPDKANRDMIHKNNVNIVTAFPGDGPVVYSQKTLTNKTSAFADIDVRRLFIYMEKAISTASRFFLFEKNTAFTRRQLYNMIFPFLEDIVGREGIESFVVICDESNNTDEVIGRNQMMCDIYVKPTRSIYYLQLNFINVKGTVSFNEIIPQ